eukprot:COSAG03_NODE_1075_length_4882_cov_28.476479_1_plen_251_part_00
MGSVTDWADECRIVYSTSLSGTLPESLGEMAGLQYLYLHNQHLCGVIPDLSGCMSLISLRLANNSFTGLPAALPASVSHVYFDANPLNASATALAALILPLSALHAFSIGMMAVPLDLERTRIAPPQACQVGRDCSWLLQLQDTDDEPALTGSLITGLYIAFNCSCDRHDCKDMRDRRGSCRSTASMNDNADGTFTATVPRGWIKSKGQHSFRFFHRNNEIRPQWNIEDTFVGFNSLRSAQFDPIACSPL